MQRRIVVPVERLSPHLKAAWERAAPPPSMPLGWSVCPHDPAEVVEAFPLRVTAGWRLRAYQLAARGNSNGFVWALPDGVEMADPNSARVHWSDRIIVQAFSHFIIGNPLPPGGEDFRAVIEGDGSPFSYVCHSLLARVLADYRSKWHGEVWRAVDMLAGAPDVVEEDDTLTVRLCCSTQIGCEGTFTAVDTYQRGSLQFDWRYDDIVELGIGHVH